MSIYATIIEKFKCIYMSILDYVESDSLVEENYQSMLNVFNDEDIFANKEKIKIILYIILSISNNHKHQFDFYNKIEKIIIYLKDVILLYFTTDEITNIFNSNKHILFFLINNDFIKELNIKMPDSDEFEKAKKLEGENDNYICQIIRNDSVGKFISYAKINGLNVSQKIPSSKFETNELLMKKSPSLIEYACFFGSVQIFRYLRANEAEINKSIWPYAIHGCHEEIIKTLLSQDDLVDNDVYVQCVLESIKCHYSSVTMYFQSLVQMNDNYNNKIYKESIKYFNFSMFPTNVDQYFFYNFCKYDYYDVVDVLLKNEICNVNLKIKSKKKRGSYNQYKSLFKTVINRKNFNLLNLLLRQKGVIINRNDFGNVKTLTELIIYPETASIDEYTFHHCINLERIYLNCSINVIKAGTFCDCKSLTEIIIPYSVESIESCAFSECSSLKRVVFLSQDNLEKIGYSAFSECSSLTEINIPQSVKNIGSSVFSGCTLLSNIFIPPLITEIEKSFFEKCKNIIYVLIPKTVQKIKESVFSECILLEKINIPNSVTEIGGYAFNECKSLKQIFIPSSVTVISWGLFYQCSSLTQIDIPYSVTSIEERAFYQCTSLENIIIPELVNSIGSCAFSNCKSLIQIRIPPQVSVIEGYLFDGCEKLEKIILPSKLNEIGKYAFQDCISLIEMKIPPSVKYIGECAFKSCSSLQNIILPPILSSVRYAIFHGCSSLTKIEIPESYDIISKWLFYECSNLEEISLPKNIERIQKGAFRDCCSLKKIKIPSSIRIEKDAFKNCSALQEFSVFKKDDNNQGKVIFKDEKLRDCISLDHITAPYGVEIIIDRYIRILRI